MPVPNKNCSFLKEVRGKQMCMFTVCVWHTSTGAKGNLTERSDYILANVLVTVISVLLVIYFLTYQTYVMRADVITSSILIVAYGVDGLVALSMLTRLVRLVLHSSLYHKHPMTVIYLCLLWYISSFLLLKSQCVQRYTKSASQTLKFPSSEGDLPLVLLFYCFIVTLLIEVRLP